MDTITHTANGTPLVTLSYDYDPNGNRDAETLAHAGQPPVVSTYTHDEADRLASMTVGGATTTYTLDGAGNRTRERTAPAGAPATLDRTCTFDPRDRLEGCTDSVSGVTETHGWDATGRRTSETVGGLTRTTTWDARDRLLTLTESGGPITTYTYDPEGLRIESRRGAEGERVQYEAGHRHAETNGAGNVNRTYQATAPHRATSRGAWARAGAAAMTLFLGMADAGAIPTPRHYLHDAHGTPVAITTHEGALAQRSTWDVWGNPTQVETLDTGLTANPNRIGFTGYVLDLEGSRTSSGASATANSPISNARYYAKARYYGAGRGSFLSVDPWDGDIANPVSLNKYLYGYANPGVYIDPDGRCGMLAFAAAGFGLGAACDAIDAWTLGLDASTADPADKIMRYRLTQAQESARLVGRGIAATAETFADVAVAGRERLTGESFGASERLGDRLGGAVDETADYLGNLPVRVVDDLADFTWEFKQARATQDPERMGRLTAPVVVAGATVAAGVAAPPLRVAMAEGRAAGTIGEGAHGAPEVRFNDLDGEFRGDQIEHPNARPVSPSSGPVRLRPPPNATAEEIAQIQAYCQGCNDALARGELSPTGRVSTSGQLRRDASRAAARERARAEAAGQPYTGHAGHVPDTTWTGNALPPSWSDLSPRVNTRLGGQAGQYPIGFKPTVFEMLEDLENSQ